MKNKIKISVATPVQQHSYKTAIALKKSNCLKMYHTTVYYQEKKLLYKLLRSILSKNNRERMLHKRANELDSDVKTSKSLLGLIYLLVIRYDKAKNITPFFKRILCKSFSYSVYHELKKNDINMLIMNDLMACETFERVKKHHAPTILVLDMASVPATYIRNIIDFEKASNDPFKEDLEAFDKSFALKYMKFYKKEINLADYFFAACNFTKDKLIEYGIEAEKIYYLPLGVDIINFPEKKKYKIEKTIKFLFVGRVEAAKGVYYLLEAFKQCPNLPVELIIAGEVNCDVALYSDCDNITFLGAVNKTKMPELYQSADVYVLSSLWEGFSLSLFEAMASGLPVIASENSCAPDVISEGIQGFVYNPLDICTLKSKVEWYVNNVEMIEVMGKNAHKLAEKYNWTVYEMRLNEIIEDIAQKEGLI